jgi:DNA-binding protein HU-beta
MNKTELVEAIAKESGLSGKDAEAALNATVTVIEKSLKKKQDVRITGFGTFSITRTKARKGRNPATGEEIKIKASNSPRFKAGKTLKDFVNGVKK